MSGGLHRLDLSGPLLERDHAALLPDDQTSELCCCSSLLAGQCCWQISFCLTPTSTAPCSPSGCCCSQEGTLHSCACHHQRHLAHCLAVCAQMKQRDCPAGGQAQPAGSPVRPAAAHHHPHSQLAGCLLGAGLLHGSGGGSAGGSLVGTALQHPAAAGLHSGCRWVHATAASSTAWQQCGCEGESSVPSCS